MSEVEKEELKLEKLKIIYEQAGNQHRYFLNWRYFLTVGYFAILGSFIIAVWFCFKEGGSFRKMIFVIPLSFSFLSFFFWLLDRRIRDLYHTCRRVACMVEQEFNLGLKVKEQYACTPCKICKNSDFNNTEGLFFLLCFAHDKHGRKSVTHSSLFNYMYWFMFSLSILLSIVALFIFNIHCVLMCFS